jgi:sigma-B regulation protein RsbU (phosphoserine phosphatase)
MNESTNVTTDSAGAGESLVTKCGPRRTLRRQILAFVTALNVVSTIVACAIAYNFQKVAFLHGVDKVLSAGAVSGQHDFGHAFHQRALNEKQADDPSPDEELKNVRRISELADQLQLNYIGALVRKDGRYFYTVTSSPQREIDNGTYDRMWTEYDDATPTLSQTFADGQLRFEQHSDRYGNFRSAYVPYRLPGSSQVDYVFVADMGLDYIYGHLRATLAKTAVAGAGICAVSLCITRVLANKLTGPLTKLAGLIHAIAEHDFRTEPDERQSLAVIAATSHEEVSQVATAFGRMEQRLQDYFVELERSTAERERVSSELSLAHDIQMGLLPCQLPGIPGCDLFARVIPAKEVGGDLFDVAVMDDGRVMLVIADVSGKGISAGLFMAVAKTLLGVARTHGTTAHGIVEFLNDQLSANNDALMFVTMFLALFDPRTGELAYSNAGHNPPYIRRRDGTIEPLAGRHGMALGIKGDESYICQTTTLLDGDLLLLYTDGITEAQDASQALFSESRLETCLRQTAADSAGEAGTAVIDAVAEFQGAAPQFDDITLVALRYTTPVPAPLDAAAV